MRWRSSKVTVPRTYAPGISMGAVAVFVRFMPSPAWMRPADTSARGLRVSAPQPNLLLVSASPYVSMSIHSVHISNHETRSSEITGAWLYNGSSGERGMPEFARSWARVSVVAG